MPSILEVAKYLSSTRVFHEKKVHKKIEARAKSAFFIEKQHLIFLSISCRFDCTGGTLYTPCPLISATAFMPIKISFTSLALTLYTNSTSLKRLEVQKACREFIPF